MRSVEVNLHTPKEPFTGKVIETRLLTGKKSPHFTRHVVVDVSGSKLEGKVWAGQSIGVLPPGTTAQGRPEPVRLYSSASPVFGEDGEGGHYALCVKRLIDENWDDHTLFLGVASNYICDRQVGDEIMLTGPSGKHFLLPEDPAGHNFVFIATGTGIAPFRGMLKELEKTGFSGTVALYFGVPYSTDILYDDEFRAYEEKLGLRYRVALSREDTPRTGARKYVDAALAEDEAFRDVLRDPATLVYVCGIKGMEKGLYPKFLKWETGLLSAPEGFSPDAPPDDPGWRQVRPRRGRLFVEVY